VGVLAPHLHRLSLTPPPPPPPHKGEESSLGADLRIMKPISGKPERGGEESPSRQPARDRTPSKQARDVGEKRFHGRVLRQAPARRLA
jgi:hypothetical protein